jgi:hypothetical protein
MNQVLEWLSGGDIRSDGLSSDVASLVLKNDQLYNELLEGLSVEDDLIRGRAADALEKIARSRPDLLVDDLALFIKVGQEDPVPMVRWHIAMIFGHLAPYEELTGQVTRTLLDYLQDTSVFVKSWSIVSLCIIGRMYSSENKRIVEAIVPLERDSSIAIRSKVKKAIPLLMNDRMPFPKGRIKSKQVELLVMSATSA